MRSHTSFAVCILLFCYLISASLGELSAPSEIPETSFLGEEFEVNHKDADKVRDSVLKHIELHGFEGLKDGSSNSAADNTMEIDFGLIKLVPDEEEESLNNGERRTQRGSKKGNKWKILIDCGNSRYSNDFTLNTIAFVFVDILGKEVGRAFSPGCFNKISGTVVLRGLPAAIGMGISGTDAMFVDSATFTLKKPRIKFKSGENFCLSQNPFDSEAARWKVKYVNGQRCVDVIVYT